MNIQKCEPLEVRTVYELRLRKHIGRGSAVFAVIFIPAIFVLNSWSAILIVFLIAGGLGYLLYFYLESRLLVIACPRCRNDINTNTPWECGFKGCKNLNVDEFPFVRECEHCHYIPKAYICHHGKCNNPIFLTTDKQELHAARRLENLELPVKIVKIVIDPTKDNALRQKVEIGNLEHELDVETLKKKIAIEKNKPVTGSVTKTPDEILEEAVLQGIKNADTLYNIEKRLKAKEAAKYPAGSPELEKEYAKIEAEIAKHMT